MCYGKYPVQVVEVFVVGAVLVSPPPSCASVIWINDLYCSLLMTAALRSVEWIRRVQDSVAMVR